MDLLSTIDKMSENNSTRIVGTILFLLLRIYVKISKMYQNLIKMERDMPHIIKFVCHYIGQK